MNPYLSPKDDDDNEPVYTPINPQRRNTTPSNPNTTSSDHFSNPYEVPSNPYEYQGSSSYANNHNYSYSVEYPPNYYNYYNNPPDYYQSNTTENPPKDVENIASFEDSLPLNTQPNEENSDGNTSSQPKYTVPPPQYIYDPDAPVSHRTSRNNNHSETENEDESNDNDVDKQCCKCCKCFLKFICAIVLVIICINVLGFILF